MRTALLLLIFLVCLQAGAQQAFNPYSNASSFVPANPNPDIRLLAIGSTHYDSVMTGNHDSTTYSYSAGRGWNSQFGYWQYDLQGGFRQNGKAENRYIQTYNRNGEVIKLERQELNVWGNWVVVETETYTYQNNKLATVETVDFHDKKGKEYLYNANGQMTEEISREAQNANGTLKDKYKYVRSYGPDGVTDQIFYAKDAQGGWRTSGDSVHYSYVNGKLTEVLKVYRSNNIWVNYSLSTNWYGSNGKPEKHFQLYWNTTLANWDTAVSYTYHYDNNRRDTLVIIENPKTGWIGKDRYSYDAAGYIVNINSKIWKPSVASWNNSYELRFYYGQFNLDISYKKDDTKQVSIYPVPASKYLNIDISMPVKQELQLAIYHIDGRVLRSWNQPAISTDYKEQIDLSSIPPGNYSLQVNSADGKIVKQFTITR